MTKGMQAAKDAGATVDTAPRLEGNRNPSAPNRKAVTGDDPRTRKFTDG